ncbi:hypothetical protein WAJ79_25140, partial [Acinetobacter baumannii]
CLLADPSLKIEELEPAKNLKIVVGQEKAAKVLHTLNLNELPQYEGDEPYVLILSDQTDIKTAKQLQQQFEQTSVESHHYIYV